ncbi:MAG: hypothetical protein SGPRY_011591, partial [Prymnesium sp.]
RFFGDHVITEEILNIKTLRNSTPAMASQIYRELSSNSHTTIHGARKPGEPLSEEDAEARLPQFSPAFPATLFPCFPFLHGDCPPIVSPLSQRLVVFENIFLKIDIDSNGFLSRNHAIQCLIFLAIDVDPTVAELTVDAVLGEREHVHQQDFIRLCMQLAWTVPLQLLHLATDNFFESNANNKQRNMDYWGLVSRQVDTIARVVFPVVYAFVLCVLFSIDMSDDYSEGYRPMFEGIGNVAVRAGRIWSIALIPFLVVVLVLIRWNWNRIHRVLKVEYRSHLLSIANAAAQALL